jgi:hypothetical protein
MHILIITKELPYGSQETFLIPELLALSCSGNKVTVIPRKPPAYILHETAGYLQPHSIKESVFNLKIMYAVLLMVIFRTLKIWKTWLLKCKSRNIKIFIKNMIVFPKALWIARTALLLPVDHI